MKYSINGGDPVVSRIGVNSETYARYAAMYDHIDAIPTLLLGQVFETSGGSEISAFRAYQFNSIYGASMIDEGVVDSTPTTFKFLTADAEDLQMGDKDLVHDLFGGDLEIHSCAFREWPGL